MGEENQGVDQQICRILVAEDNDGDIFLIRRALDMHIGPYGLLLAKDGEAAMDVLERANAGESTDYVPISLVLDLNLPRHTGIQILERSAEASQMRHRSRHHLYVLGLPTRQSSRIPARR